MSATIKAISEIKHIPDGEYTNDQKKHLKAHPTYFAIGDELTDADFSEDQLRQLVESGCAVEIGKDRRFSPEPDATSAAAVASAADKLRDELIVQSQQVSDPTPKPKTKTEHVVEDKKDTPPPAPVK